MNSNTLPEALVTDALTLAAHGQAERLAWGSIALSVTDLPRAVSFWTHTLGLLARDIPGGVALGTESMTLVTLHPGARRSVERRATGLYHVAIGVPTQVEFSRLMARLMALRVQASPVDHTMSKAIYLNDPDGHGIEIAFETPERFGRFAENLPGFGIYDANGRLRSGRDPLDIRAELEHARSADLTAPLADGSIVAHLHLQVSAIEPSLSWFEKLGFARNLQLPQMGFADMGAGAAYTHRLALNIWAGRNAPSAAADSARLLSYTLMSHAEPQSLVDPTGARVMVEPFTDCRMEHV